MTDIRVKDLAEASVPGADYYLLTDSATDGVKKVKTTNIIAKADIGLGNVDNTSDANKPISTATQTALSAKADSAGLATVATSGAYSDLSGRPTLGTAAAIDVGVTSNKVVQLDGSGKLPAVDGSQLTGIGATTYITQDGTGAVASPLIAKVKQDVFHVADFADRNNYATTWDGTTDNTAVVQAAISAAISLGKRKVDFPDIMRINLQNIGNADFRQVYGVLVNSYVGLELRGHGTQINAYDADTTLHAGIFKILNCSDTVVRGFNVVAQSGAVWNGSTNQAAAFVASFRASKRSSLIECSSVGGLGLCDLESLDVRNGYDAEIANQITDSYVRGSVKDTVYGIAMMGAQGVDADIRVNGDIVRSFFLAGFVERAKLVAQITNLGGLPSDTSVAHISNNFQSNPHIRNVSFDIQARDLNSGSGISFDLRDTINPTNTVTYPSQYAGSTVTPLIEDVTISGTITGCNSAVIVTGNTTIDAGAVAPVVRRIRMNNLTAIADRSTGTNLPIWISTANLPAGSTIESVEASSCYFEAAGATPNDASRFDGVGRVVLNNVHAKTNSANAAFKFSNMSGNAFLTSCKGESTSTSDQGIVRDTFSGLMVLDNYESATGLAGDFAPTNWATDTGATIYKGPFIYGSTYYGNGPLFLGTISSNLLDLSRGTQWRLQPGAAVDLKGFTNAKLYTNTIVSLVFENSNTTLKHNAAVTFPFILKGGADYKPPINTSINFRFDGNVPCWIEEGGDSDWVSYTPTVTTGAGGPPTYSVTKARYKKIGRAVHWSAIISITAANGGTGDVIITLPFTPSYDASVSGRENAINGKGLAGVFRNIDSKAHVWNYDNSTANIDGTLLVVDGVFETSS